MEAKAITAMVCLSEGMTLTIHIFQMKLFTSIAAVTFITTAGATPAAARHMTGCADFGCYSIKIGRDYDAVAWQFSNGKSFSGNITCSPGTFRLHDGWVGDLDQDRARAIVKAHCANRGRLFN
jgi:hypothetical protein